MKQEVLALFKTRLGCKDLTNENLLIDVRTSCVWETKGSLLKDDKSETDDDKTYDTDNMTVEGEICDELIESNVFNYMKSRKGNQEIAPEDIF
eukprot:UN33838